MLLIYQYFYMNGQVKKYFLYIAFIFVFILAPAKFIFAATIVENAPSEVHKGDVISVEWSLDTNGETINVVDGNIQYQGNMIDILSIEPSDVGPIIWVNGPLNANNNISFTGGIPVGARGVVPLFRTLIEIKENGLINFNINPESKSYLADGTGNPIPLSMVPFNINSTDQVSPIENVIVISHPDETKWYHNNNVQINFTPTQNTSYSYSLSTDLNIVPNQVPQILQGGSIAYTNLVSGQYYFKLSSKSLNLSWNLVSTKIIRIDFDSPTISSAAIGHDQSLFDDQPFLSLMALDKLSGVSTTEAKIGLFGFYHLFSGPYLIHRPLVGDTISLRVYDKAGNESVQTIPYAGYISTKEFLFAIITLALFAFVGVFVYKKIICKKNI